MASELTKGALGVTDALMMAVAGSAPAYSITASTAALVAAVGMAGPAALVYAAIPMIGITVAFAWLNKWRSDAGAAYAWVGRSMHPVLGFLSGWALLSLSTIFMVAAALPAGEATLDLFAPGQLHNVPLATGLGAVWFLVILAVVTVGITATARVQIVLTLLEVGTLVLVGTAAIVVSWHNPVHAFTLEWFSPTAFGSFEAFSAGMLVAVFYYFGWDVSSNLAEETADAQRSAGLGGIAGVFVVFALFLLLQVATQMAMTPSDIQSNSANLLPALGAKVLPQPWASLAILAVVVSAIATIETQLLQCTRLLFSMARDRVISEKLGELHPRFQTPWIAGFAVAGVSLLLFAVSATVPTINVLMSDLINAIGVQVSFYYAIAGVACAWFYRRRIRDDWKIAVFAFAIPLLSAGVVAVVGLSQIPQLGWRVAALSIGTIVIGFLPMAVYRAKYRSAFYTDPAESA
jgi:amino acid transporter